MPCYLGDQRGVSEIIDRLLLGMQVSLSLSCPSGVWFLHHSPS